MNTPATVFAATWRAITDSLLTNWADTRPECGGPARAASTEAPRGEGAGTPPGTGVTAQPSGPGPEV